MFFFPHGNSVVYHGIEGQWRPASQDFEALVRPLIEAALGQSAGDAPAP